MHLQYSQMMDLGAGLGANKSEATPRTVFDVMCRRIGKMVIAPRLPDLALLGRLPGLAEADEEGDADHRIDWAAQKDEKGELERWSIRVSHPDGEDERIHRQLQVHCRARAKGGVSVGVRLLFLNAYGVYLERTPPIRPPRLVAELLALWVGSRGQTKVSKRILHLREHSRIGSAVAAPERDVPIVLVGPRVFENAVPIRVQRRFTEIERLLGGTVCFVGLPEDRDVRAFNKKVDRSLGLPDGSDLAILWPIEPGSNKEQLLDRRDIMGLDEFSSGRALAERMFELVAERSTFLDPGAIQSIDGLRMAATVTVPEAPSREAEYDKEMLQVALEENSGYRRRIVELEELLKEAREDLFNARAKNSQRQRASHAGSLDAMQKPWALYQGLTVEDARTALKLFCESSLVGTKNAPRVVVPEQCFESVASNQYPQPIRLLATLGFIATEFLDRVRTGASSAELQRLAEEEGFVYAPTETAETMKSPRLRKLRIVEHDGEEHSCVAHFKWGKARNEKCLRVYLSVLDPGPSARILLGHVGGHLESASTGK